MKVYVVAVSQKEAEMCAEQIGWAKRSDAETHLREVKKPPTDPYYAAMYRIYKCEVEAKP